MERTVRWPVGQKRSCFGHACDKQRAGDGGALKLHLTLEGGGKATDVAVTIDAEATLAHLAEALRPYQPAPGQLRGRSGAITGSAPVGRAGLRHGDRLRSDGAPPVARRSRTRFELAVVGGLGGGTAIPLTKDQVIVGRVAPADLVINDPAVSSRHLMLRGGDRGLVVKDLDSTNGTRVNGVALKGEAQLGEGDLVQLGGTTLLVRPTLAADAAMADQPSGTLAYNRPMRIRRPLRPIKVQLPKAPAEHRSQQGIPLTAVLSPIALGVMGAVVYRRPEALLIAFISPVLALVNRANQKKARERERHGEAGVYKRAHLEATGKAATAQRQLAHERRIAWPDPTAVVQFATTPNRRLWERRSDDSDALDVRVGLADRPVGVEVAVQGEEAAQPIAPGVPVVVPLRQVGVLGIAGPAGPAAALARWVVLQLAVLHSPRNLTLVLLQPDEAPPGWSWFRWLPHAQPDDGPTALVGNSAATRSARVKELVKLVEDRVEARRSGKRDEIWQSEVVVVLDGARHLRSVPGLAKVLREGPAVGVFAVAIDTESAYLPEEGKAEVVFSDDGVNVEVVVAGEDPIEEVAADGILRDAADAAARAMAPVRDVSGEGADLLPASVRFTDLLKIDLDDPETVVGRWRLLAHSTRSCIGVDSDGPFELDIDFKADGPHSLIVGSTGSGKSEFLRTFLAGLAVNNRPDAMNLVLIDFKGGGAFAAFEELPHTVGFVTNLDAGETQRALVSLDAELERRQRELRELGVDNLEAAWAADPDGASRRHLSRLIIAIDELAELVDELPDFVPGLIRIARVGRSLGVHLVLATQRPSAKTVTPEMRTNTALRVALRVNDKGDSTDVIDAPDAAMIPKSLVGRGFVRTERRGLVQFQTALSSGTRPGAARQVSKPLVSPVSWSTIGVPLAEPKGSGAVAAATTDLDALVGLLRKAADRLSVEPSPSPWLPPLPRSLTVDLATATTTTATGTGGQIVPALIGREDLPSEQRQRDSCWALDRDGNIGIVGAARSGRTTAVRTMLTSLAAATSPSDVHIYCLDFGNGGLLPLRDLPHCGAVALRTEPERVERLLDKLTEELRRRQEVLARLGVADIAEQRRRATVEHRLPYMVVALDRWDAFQADFSSEAVMHVRDGVLRLVREGLGAGMRFVITGDATMASHRVAQTLERKLVLRLGDRLDYKRLIGLDPKSVPEALPPGRGYWADGAVESQVGLLVSDPSGEAQGEAVRLVARDTAARWPAADRSNAPMRVDVLPTTIGLDDVWPQVEPSGPLWVLVGVGGDDAGPVGFDLGVDGPGFVIGGPPKSGRSGALLTMATSALRSGTSVIVVAPRAGPLTSVKGCDGVLGVHSGLDIDGDALMAQLEGAVGPVLVVADDAEQLVGTRAEPVLEAALSVPGRRALALGGRIDELSNVTRGFVPKARRSELGVLLSPSSVLHPALLGLKLARSQLGKQPAGRGFANVQGVPTMIQVPTVPGQTGR